MITLEESVRTITQNDYALLNNFIAHPATPQSIQKIGSKIAISDSCLTLLHNVSKDEMLHKAILLASAAKYSENFTNQFMYGFRITIRSSGEIRTNCYIDIDGYTIIHLIEEWNENYDWNIIFLNPIIFTENFNYATEAVLKLCQ